MFALVKILGGGRNVPEPKHYTLTETVSVRYGTPVALAGGKLTPLTSTSTIPATHLVMADAEGREVLCARITPDMIFETRVSAAPAAMRAGTEYALSADGQGVSATAVSGSVRGACLYDTCGAKKSGDALLVYFQNGL